MLTKAERRQKREAERRRLQGPKKRGRPFGTTRGRSVADVSTVRIDAATKDLLKHEFGSLGNALFYIASGILEYRRQYSLAGPDEIHGTAPAGMDYQELAMIRTILWHHVDRHRGPNKAIAPFVALLRRLEAVVWGPNAHVMDLPPVPDIGSVPRKKRRRRSRFVGIDPSNVIGRDRRKKGSIS